jgi:hemoglobin
MISEATRQTVRPALRALLLAVCVVAAAIGAWSAHADDTLYRALGGRENLVRIVDYSTDLWLIDPRIKDTFDNLNIERFKRRLVDQLCELSGGPCHYTGRNMYESHKGLYLNRAHFNALVEGLQDGMDKYGVPFRVQNRLLAILAPMEHDIVTR